ncbi:efflux RND transporter periplasmic adaptor subunit [Pseudomonas sp. FW215-R2]|jgi:macrolide-specific efflux system membrane fusion protein|uniref:efflux RND transporter periplasmic adaptor subunit n=1 Tax=unclassified Pseudomonas TaxID=196821 RepID=UPI000BCE3642|nr:MULTISPECIES: efflux RND transporter periplasmic adaptor subunit [unclassified Pseudomonas]PCR97630.1 efflux transporter periplasmic adaptor subunit [Pseudomonas fluorescens]PMW99890.1 efflux RND transporter periplasmic adaptor subunit [Pseudomonas sp. FW215-R2]PMX09120.1 efflux RND transporter periplasmic adaptor subunit [Pseudomonas sp. FW215-L1]PMX21523.1 efflux RND transporter periplasmic adaptor subunit [Pseudomonas sp. FW215-E1]PNA21282.1 efflux RND transporter periplasmic adaptor sub
MVFFSRSRIVFGTLPVVALLVWFVWGQGWGTPPKKFLTATVTVEDLEETVLASGTVKPFQQVSVGAQVNGQLQSLKAGLGDTVRQGQLLAEIDPLLPQNELLKSRAALLSVRAQYKARQAMIRQYELDFRRKQSLVASEAGSRADLEIAEAQLQSSRAELASLAAQISQAEIEIRIAEVNLGYTRISAPMDGEVIAVVTRQGQTVVSAQSVPTLLILARLDRMTVEARISEADVVRVKAGQAVSFNILGDPDRRFTSHIRAVEPAPESIARQDQMQGGGGSTAGGADAAVYYNALFDVPNDDRSLRTSMTAQVSVLLDSVRKATTVSVAALGKRAADGRYEVRRLVDGQPQTVLVTTGLRNDLSVQVLDGLKENDEVVLGEEPEPR